MRADEIIMRRERNGGTEDRNWKVPLPKAPGEVMYRDGAKTDRKR